MAYTHLDIDEKTLDKYDAFIFDLDGTLIDTDCSHNQIMNDLYLEYGGHEIITTNAVYFGMTPHDLVVSLLTHADVSLDHLEAILEKKYERTRHLLEEHGIKTLPGLELARKYKGTKKIGIGTGATRKYFSTYNKQVHLTDVFDANIVTADDVVHYKPHPETYLRVAHKLGVDPARCLVFEDLEMGVQSALGAGMDCFNVTTQKLYHPATDLKPEFKQQYEESIARDQGKTIDLATVTTLDNGKVIDYKNPDDYPITNCW